MTADPLHGPMRTCVRALACIASALAMASPAVARGQSTTAGVRSWLSLDTALVPVNRPGCEVTGAADTRSANAGLARVAWREAQEALLEGNRTAARTKLEQAVTADPRDVRAWQEFGAVLEQLGDSVAARAAACRVLELPSASDAQRVEAERRWTRMLSSAAARDLRLAQRRHEEGVRLAQRGQWQAARAAFDDVVRGMPGAPSAWRNRAIVTAEAGAWSAAERDLERYMQMGPPAGDRLRLARALAALRRSRYSAGTAFVAGLLPGGAQFATGRPAFGVLVLAAAGGSVALSNMRQTRERTVPYVDPNGQPAPYVEQYEVRPYRSAGIAAGVTVLAAALAEGVAYANRSGRLPLLVASATERARGETRVTVGIRLRR